MTTFTTTSDCLRCGRGGLVNAPGTADARPIRRKASGAGLCASCAATAFLQNTEPINIMLKRTGPDALRAPHVREQFSRMMKAGRADIRETQVDWDAVVANWDLPIKGAKQ